MVTIVNLIEAYSRKPRSSVWIVPGGLADMESEENEQKHIDEFLSERGICLCSKVPPETAAERVNEALTKFQLANVPVERETLCND